MSFDPHSTMVAVATGEDSSVTALLRISGPNTRDISRKLGWQPEKNWQEYSGAFALAAGPCPCRYVFFAGPKSYTGFDTLEIQIPGGQLIRRAALDAIVDAGAQLAEPGAFSRQALHNGKLSLDRAEAVLAMSQAMDAQSAADALDRLRGALHEECQVIHDRLLEMRALVEVGLDFSEEDDVQTYNPQQLQDYCREIIRTLGKWQRASIDLGLEPHIALVGPANAGKSALFQALSGQPALVSNQAGTTRDWLRADIQIDGRNYTLIDTAGWMDTQDHLDRDAIAAGQEKLSSAALVILCSAPDARVSENWQEFIPIERSLFIATKQDLGHSDERAQLAVSVQNEQGLSVLRDMLRARLQDSAAGDQRQQRHLENVIIRSQQLTEFLPDDPLLADDLRYICDELEALVGQVADDDILNAIFGRFCIGK